jgi:putative AlgH/UPF0301 family transcriptional regulator
MSAAATPVLDLTIEELLAIVEHTRDGAIGLILTRFRGLPTV